jgi:trehalose 6-phosphate phosphatase
MFAPLKLPAAGQHGVERRDARGRVHSHPVPEDALRRAASFIRAFAARHEGLVFEDKGASVALHYRLAPQLAGAAHSAVKRAALELGEGVEVQTGKMVAELKPSGRDKGMAIEEFMREVPFKGRVPVFLGDDLTDEQGFEVVNKLGGHSVKIGSGPSVARWRLQDAASVRRWLSEGLERLPAAAKDHRPAA